ncbi:MAG: hypothetical protein ABIO70_02535 [Pseudomonadota bacterium]
MRTLLLFALLLCACPPAEKPAGDDTGPGPDTQDTIPEDTALTDCGLIDGIAFDPGADGQVPGATFAIAVRDAGTGAPYTVAWSASSGTIADPAAAETTWTVGTDTATWVGEVLDLEVEVLAEGCAPETRQIGVAVDWPAAARVLVISNPNVARSDEVALAYADFRGVPAENLCAIPAADATTLTAADAPAFAAALEECLAVAGPRSTPSSRSGACPTSSRAWWRTSPAPARSPP